MEKPLRTICYEIYRIGNNLNMKVINTNFKFYGWNLSMECPDHLLYGHLVVWFLKHISRTSALTSIGHMLTARHTKLCCSIAGRDWDAVYVWLCLSRVTLYNTYTIYQIDPVGKKVVPWVSF